MSTELLSQRTLVLDSQWQVVSTISVKEAIGKVYTGLASILGRNYALYDFDSWVYDWQDLRKVANIDDGFLVASHFKVYVPEVIVLHRKGRRRSLDVKFSRRNVFLRDKHRCQYCYKQFSNKELNLDHVIPKSRGGKTTWENIVLSCIPCNQKKADRTPEEAKMNLLNRPKKPHWTALNTMNKAMPSFWKNFVDAVYWNTEIDED